MTTFGQSMIDAASRLAAKFSEDIGTSTITHIIDEVYNTSTGKTVELTKDETVDAVFVNLILTAVPDQSFAEDHFTAIIPGKDLLLPPAKDDIIYNKNIGHHRIAKVNYDQYKAAFIVAVEKKIVAQLP